MPSRSYVVNYDINARTNQAVEAFRAMVSPMQEAAQSMAVVEKSISNLLSQQEQLKRLGKLSIKPTVDLTSYKNALATMEQNAKETAIRVRRAIDASLGGSQKDFVKAISNLGTGNFKEAKASLSGQISEVERQIKHAQALYDREARLTKKSSDTRRKQVEQAKNMFGDSKSVATVAKSVNRFAEKLGMEKLFTYDAKNDTYLHPMAETFDEFKKRAGAMRESLIAENEQIARNLENRTTAIKAGAPTGKIGFSNLLGFGLDEIERTATAIGTLTQGINDLRTMASGGVVQPSSQSTKAIDDFNKATAARKAYQDQLKKAGSAPKQPKTYPNADEIARLQQEVQGLDELKEKQAKITEQRKAIAKIKKPDLLPSISQKQGIAMYDRLMSDASMERIAREAKEDVVNGNIKKSELQDHIKKLQENARRSAWQRAGFRSEQHFRDVEKIVRDYQAWESRAGTASAPTEDYTEQIKQKEAAQKRLNTLLRQKQAYDTKLQGWQSKVSGIAKPVGWVSDTEYARLEQAANAASKISAVKQEAGKPTQVKFDIIGNFKENIADLLRLAEVITNIPKEVLINVGLKDTAQQSLLVLDGISKLKSKTVTINVDGNYKAAIADLKTLQGLTGAGATKTGKGKKDTGKGISVNAKLNQGGIFTEIQQLITKLQAWANEKFIYLQTKLWGTNLMREQLMQMVTNLQNLALERYVNIRTILDRTTIGMSLQQALLSLQNLANSRPIRFKASLTTAGLRASLNQALTQLKAGTTQLTLDALIGKIKLPTAKPTVKVNAIIDKAPRFANGANNGIVANVRGVIRIFKNQVNAAIRSLGDIFIRAKVQLGWATGAGSKQSQLKNLQSKLPTLKIKLDISEAEATLNRLIAKIKALSPQTIKVTDRTNTGGGGGGRRSYGGTIGGTRSVQNESLYDRTRRAMYPFTGNTSFGARTPVAFDMVKGMGMMYGIGGAMGVISDSFGQAVQYQNTMETARAILEQNYRGNNFNTDFAEMVRTAREVAVKTKFTAAQTSDAVRFMAMAGLDIPMIKASIAPIADIAVIGDNDLGEVADKMTNIQTAFKLGPEKMRHLADAMAKTMTSTNTDMMMLAESMQYAAPMAHLAGASVEDALAMIGIMGNSGIQASMAGTTLRMMYQNIIQPNKKQKAMWDQLGISLRDKDGNVRNLMAIMQDLAKRTKSQQTAIDLLGGEDKASGNKRIDQAAGERSGVNVADAVSRLFRVTASAGAGSIVEGINKVIQLSNDIRNSDGIAAYVSGKKQATVSGLWHQVTSAFTEGVVKVFENQETQTFIKDMLGGLKAMFNSPEFTETLHNLFGLVKDIGSVMATFVGWWIRLYQTFPNLTKWVLVGQAFFTQIGYLITPFVQFVGLLDKLGITMSRLNVQAATMNGAMAGGIITAATNPVFGGRTNPALYARYAEAARVNQSRADMLNAAMVASMASNQRTARMSQLAFESQRRATEYMAAAQIAREQYRKNRLQDTALLQRAASMGKLSWRGLGAGVSAAFNAGMTAMSFAGLWGSIKGGLTSVVLNLSRVLGMLVSPAGLAVAAIGALVTGVVWYTNKIKESNQNLKDAVERGKPIVDSINNRLKPIQNSTFATADNVKAINDVTENAAQQTKWRINPLLKNTRGFSDIYKRDRYTSETEYNKAMFEQHIAPMSQFLFGREISYDEFQKEANEKSKTYYQYTGGPGMTGGMVAAKDTASYYKNMAEKAAVYQLAFNSPEFKKAYSEYAKLLNKWNALSPDEKLKNTDNLRAQIIQMRDQFGGWAKGGLKSVSDYGDISKAKQGDLMQTSEAQKAIWDFFDKIITDKNSAINTEAALNTIKTGELFSQDWYTSLDTVLSNIQLPFRDANGNLQKLTLAFDGTKPIWETLLQKFEQYGIKYGQTETERANIIQEIIKRLADIPGMSSIVEKLGGIAGLTSSILDKMKDPFEEAAARWYEGFVERGGLETPWGKWAKENNQQTPKPETKQEGPIKPEPQKPFQPYKWGDNGSGLLGMQQSVNDANEKLKRVSVSNIDQKEYASTYVAKNNGGKAPVSINLGGINFGNIQVENTDQRQIAEQLENKIAEGLAIAIGNLQPMLASVAENELT